MKYLNEADIIRIIAEKCKVDPEDVTLKLDIKASRIAAIVEEKPKEDDGMVFVIKKDQIDPKMWDRMMDLLKRKENFIIFSKEVADELPFHFEEE